MFVQTNFRVVTPSCYSHRCALPQLPCLSLESESGALCMGLGSSPRPDTVFGLACLLCEVGHLLCVAVGVLRCSALRSAYCLWRVLFTSRWPSSSNEKPETDNWDTWAAQPSLTVPSAGQLRQRSAFTPATATGSSPSPVLGQVGAASED